MTVRIKTDGQTFVGQGIDVRTQVEMTQWKEDSIYSDEATL